VGKGRGIVKIVMTGKGKGATRKEGEEIIS